MQTKVHSSNMEKLKTEYQSFLKRNGQLSLEELWKSEDFCFKSYSENLELPVEIESILKSAKEFGEKHGIWRKYSTCYINAGMYNFSNGRTDRLLEVCNFFNVGYSINDLWGRDIFGHLSEEEKSHGARIIARLSSPENFISLPEDAHPLEKAHSDLLLTFKEKSPDEWFSSFLQYWTHHVSFTHKDWHIANGEESPTVDDYIKYRRSFAADRATQKMVEYAQGEFPDWNWTKDVGLGENFQTYHEAIGNVYGLTNDFYSFEREVIDDGAPSNLLAVVAINNPSFALLDVINESAKIMRDVFKVYLTERKNILHKLSLMSNTNSENLGIIERYLTAIDISFQCCWKWYMGNMRFLRKNSIWKEMELH